MKLILILWKKRNRKLLIIWKYISNLICLQTGGYVKFCTLPSMQKNVFDNHRYLHWILHILFFFFIPFFFLWYKYPGKYSNLSTFNSIFQMLTHTKNYANTHILQIFANRHIFIKHLLFFHFLFFLFSVFFGYSTSHQEQKHRQ